MPPRCEAGSREVHDDLRKPKRSTGLCGVSWAPFTPRSFGDTERWQTGTPQASARPCTSDNSQHVNMCYYTVKRRERVMLTSLGRYLRKMRIDRGELLRDMADKVGISSAMLSSIENGKRNPASDFAHRVSDAYRLGKPERDELSRLVAENSDAVSIGLRGLEPGDQHLAFSFARRFTDLSESEKERIKEVLDEADSRE